jgi:hypothetical protein
MAKHSTLKSQIFWKRWILIFITSSLLIFNLVPAGFAQSENTGLTMHAESAFDGYFKYGEWMVVWVELENNGPDLKASVEVRIPGSGGSIVYSTPVELPTVSHKRVPLYVLPNNFSRQLEVRLVANDELITSVKIKAQPQLDNAYIVGLISGNRGALSLINGASIPKTNQRSLAIVDTKLTDLPDQFEAFRSLDCLVINDTDTSNLTAQQSSALVSWVQQGGHLVIGGGASAQKTTSGLPLSILPINLNGSQELTSLSELESFAAREDLQNITSLTTFEPIRVPGPFVVSSGDVSVGRTLVSQGDLPLIVEADIGGGKVTFVALDLSVSPFDAWNGTTDFWENLLSPDATFPSWAPPDISNRQQLAGQMPYTLSNLPMLDLPSTRGLAFLLGLYILLIGPVNYYVLRRKRILHWAWVTIPAITILFSIGAFGLGYVLHGSDVFLNKIAIVELSPDGTANTNSFIGIFSPAQRGYEVEFSDGGLLSSMSPYYSPWDPAASVGNPATGREIVLIQGNPNSVRGLSIDQWSMNSFMVEGLRFNFGRIPYELSFNNQSLVGYFRNESNQTIHDALIIINRNIFRLGDLTPGQESSVDFHIADRDSPDFGPSISYQVFQDQLNQPDRSGPGQREIEVKRQIVETLLERVPAYTFLESQKFSRSNGIRQLPIFLGWIDEAPPEIQVKDTVSGQQTTGAVIMQLSYDVPNGEITIPAGLIPGEVVELPIDGSPCGEQGSTSIYLVHGSGIIDFTLPTELQSIHLGYLRLSIWSDSGWINPPDVALFNWVSDNWTTLSGITQGINLVPEATSLVNQAGTIKVRISPQENTQACYYLAMGLQGEK